jgi:peroxiredoxin
MKPLFVIALIFCCVKLSAQRHVAYEIRGTVKNFHPGQKVYFLRVKTGHALDSLSLTDSTFVFKDETDISDEPEENYSESVAHVTVDHGGKGVDFTRLNVRSYPDMATVYLEPGITRINIIDSAFKAVIIPPKATAGHYTLDSIYMAYFKKANAAHREAGAKNLHGSDYLNFLDARTRVFKAAQKKDMWNFVKTHSDSPVSLYILKHNEENYPDYDKLEPYFDGLSAALRNTAFGKQYAAMLAGLQRVRTGAQAPDFTMKDPNGKKISLSGFRGKYVLVDFWASWCKPCREENPSVVSAYNRFSNQNFTVLGVSLDKTKDAWLQAIMDDILAWTQVSDLNFWDNAAAQLYAVKAIPQNFLLDPQGHIIAKNLFGERLTRKLKKLLSKETGEKQ